MFPVDDPISEDEQLQLLQAVTELAAALSDERAEMVRLLSSLVESQRQMAETLDEVLTSLEALGTGEVAVDPLAGIGRTAPEALRREARQTARRTEQLVARSRALVARASGNHASQDGDGDGDGAAPPRPETADGR